MSEFVLQLNNISKSFGDVKVLNDISINIRPNTVHALMGENGAGKSTLMKILFGLYTKDSGKIIFNDKEINFASPKIALENGIAMVHQELQQLLNRTVIDNIFMGRYLTKFGYIKQGEMNRKTAGILDKLNIKINPNEKLENLSVSQRQMIEIAKAVSYNSKVLVLDEPTSSLQVNECEDLFKIIEYLKANGVAIIYISHKMNEILRISDDVTIMRDGKIVSTSLAKELNIDTIIKQMVGRELEGRYPVKDIIEQEQETVLSVVNLTGKHVPTIKDVSFELKKGEILGVSGLVGSRRTEMIETLFGLREIERGDIVLNGKKIANKTPKQAIKNGFALLTEERKATGVFGNLSIAFNAVSANMKKYAKYIALNGKQIIKDSQFVVDSMSVKTPSISTPIENLSGGNQQKVILGRWLLTNPKILMLDEPTRGIDVGAKYEIYKLIIELAKKGNSIIMVSSEMEELMGVCDRILVMSNGNVAGTLDAKGVTQEKIMTLAVKYL